MMLAQFSVTPVGVGEGLAERVAELMRIIDGSGLDYRFNAMSTIVEGEWDEVMGLIKRCRDEARLAADRVLVHIAVDDRAGAAGRIDGKVMDVEAVLGRRLSR